MSLRYHVDDLLKLRTSPLCTRPTNLPPLEEWMGPQDAHTKRPLATRGKQDDTMLQNETFQKRPSLLDAPGLSRKSSTAPEDIVLGPPRRSFASANARVAAKAGTPEISEEGLSQKDRSSFHTRLRNGDGVGKNDDEDARTEGIINRRAPRYERDEGTNGRARRALGEDDGETRPRRNFDRDRERPRWDVRGGKEEADTKDAETFGLDDRSTTRRDPGGRAKFDQPWVRKSGGLDDFTKGDPRPADWRRDRGRDREWERSGKIESEPEWMDSGEVDEPPHVHTQEDFQRWKERMKAGGTPAEERKLPLSETAPAVVEEPKLPKAGARGANSSDQSDAMDIFYAKFNDQKAAAEPNPQQAKPAGRTRFASIFSPPPEVQQKQPARPLQAATEPFIAAPATESPKPPADADQEAFQRILQMLGTRNTTAAPETQGVQKQRPTWYGRKESATSQLNPEVSMAPPHKPALEEPGPMNGGSGFERLPDSMSPPQGRPDSVNNQESQLLLNLMRQANIGERQQEQRHEPNMQAMAGFANQSAMAQNQPVSAMSARARDIQQRIDDSFYDEQNMIDMREQEQQLRRGSSQRRPTNDQLPAFFDDPYMSSLRRENSQQQKPSPQHQMLPPGLQRPPGLDRMPPGWPNPAQQQQQQQQQQQARQPPPPGMSIQPQRNVFPQMNMPPPQSLPPTQQPPRRKYTGDSGVPNLPPGFGPPPGFIGMHGPPPGFPGNMNQNFPRYQDQPGMVPRSMMDRYGNVERGALRGGGGAAGLGNGMGGHFR